ncbi:MAG: M28 family peptidase [Ignavibacteria bacterium]|nr:M28 family peptidase [Ignavibacteria bacterium]
MKNIFPKLFVFAALVFSFAFNTSPKGDDITNSFFDSLEFFRNNEITKEEIYYHIKYLASDELEGRAPGTEGDHLAQKYITDEFNRYSLEPAGDSAYIQFFTLKSKITFSNDNRFSVSYKQTKNIFEIEEDYIPYKFSGNADISGELVFLGYGINSEKYNDYQNINVKDKIILIFSDVPETETQGFKGEYKYSQIRYKISDAVSAGVKGVIVIYGPSRICDEDYLPNFVYDDFSTGKISVPVIHCKTNIFKRIFSEIGLDLNKIQQEIDKTQMPNSFALKGISATIKTESILSETKTGNIIGFIKGSDPELNNQVIVVGAHYDHLGNIYDALSGNTRKKEIHNGADDNASGTAGVMELAQKISANRENFRRSFLFMLFGAEEKGLIGSDFFTKSPLFEKYNIVSMINLDMIGRLKDNMLIINGTGTSDEWNSLLDNINTKYNFKTSYIPDGLGGSDHTSFTLKKIPVLFFFTGIHGDYHRPSDDYWLINTEGQKMILEFVYDVLENISNSEKAVQFSEGKKTENKPEKERGGLKVYFGSVPDFSYSGEGFKLLAVKEGGPAQKAGLLGGDIVIKFGDKDIKDIYDYTNALGNHKPGDEVEIIVLRDGKEMNFKAKLESK